MWSTRWTCSVRACVCVCAGAWKRVCACEQTLVKLQFWFFHTVIKPFSLYLIMYSKMSFNMIILYFMTNILIKTMVLWWIYFFLVHCMLLELFQFALWLVYFTNKLALKNYLIMWLFLCANASIRTRAHTHTSACFSLAKDRDVFKNKPSLFIVSKLQCASLPYKTKSIQRLA